MAGVCRYRDDGDGLGDRGGLRFRDDEDILCESGCTGID